MVTDRADAFGGYYAEILRAEGLNEFAVDRHGGPQRGDPGPPSGRAARADRADRRSGGAARRPGCTTAATSSRCGPTRGSTACSASAPTPPTLTNGYLRVATAPAPGAGITAADDAVPRHGGPLRARRTHTTGWRRLYSDADTATSAPAVTLRSVGTAGGQAAAFAYDLARSVIGTRQGNVAWAGQERDGQREAIRSDDLFFGAAGWTSSRVAIPQADEQQRLLANLITQMNLDRTPLPRFWYLPRGGKAAVVLTGDDHGNGGTREAVRHLRGRRARPDARWRTGNACARPPTSSRRPSSPTPRRRPISAPGSRSRCISGSRGPRRRRGMQRLHDPGGPGRRPPAPAPGVREQVAEPRGVRSPAAPTASCGATGPAMPKAEREAGIRLDTNYYYWPGAWVQNRPGHVHGLRVPDALRRRRRLADRRLSGRDPAHRRVGHRRRRRTSRRCSTAPSGPRATTASSPPTCTPTSPTTPGPTRSSPRRRRAGCPSSPPGRCSTWLDGRNGSSFRGLELHAAGSLRFAVAPAAGARGLRGDGARRAAPRAG